MKILAAISLAAIFVQPYAVFSQDQSNLIQKDTALITADSAFAPEIKSSKISDSTEIKKATIYYNSNDSLAARFLINRFNLADEATRSFQHDAAGFLKLNPSNFIVEEQITPYRTTVSPFTLPGNRINVIFDGRTLHPLEHIPEPDNRIDFNDIPIASVERVYNIEGPLGLAFGADNAVASVFLIPRRPDATRAESRLIVDKGSFGYANTKVLFARRYLNGRSFRAGVEYRRADGVFSYRNDDSYHQWGEILYPLNDRIRLDLSGRLYHRQGIYTVQPDISIFAPERSRRDRDLTAGLDLYHSAERTTHLEFRHQRSESALDEYSTKYQRNLDLLDNSFSVSHDRKLGNADLMTEAVITHDEYNDSGLKKKRFRSDLEVRLQSGDSPHPAIAFIKAEKVEGFDIGISVALGYLINSPNYYLSASAGYATKLPRQYELYLVPQMTGILSGSAPDYPESGNPNIKSEKQLIGNIAAGLGKTGSDIVLSITGGKIFNGIDWQGEYPKDTSGMIVTGFAPQNKDITFAAGSAKKRLSWGDWLHLSSGGSYRYMKEGNDDASWYSPDYQLFSGLELYHHIQNLDLHLYGYIECSYAGPYFGPLETRLGEKPIINMKLSFRIKSFRFYYIFQDLPSLEYQSREYYTIPGRFNYYGLVWEFLD